MLFNKFFYDDFWIKWKKVQRKVGFLEVDGKVGFYCVQRMLIWKGFSYGGLEGIVVDLDDGSRFDDINLKKII